MDLFNLAAKLTLDGGAFDKGMKKATKEGENLAKRLTKSFNTISRAAKALIGGAVVKTVMGSMKSLIDSSAAFGDAIDKNSQVLGMSRRAYQEWDYILGQNGASIDDMTVAMKTMNAAILDKNDDVTKALNQLGVDLTLLSSLSLEDQFDYLVHQFQQMPAGAQKSALAVTLFGRQGQKLLPTLNSSSESLYGLREEFEKLGLYLDDEGVNTAVAYGDAVDAMKRTFSALKVAVGVDLMRTFIPSVKAITDYASQIKKAYEDNGLAGVFQKLVDDVKAIKWPTWDDVSTAAEAAWNAIKNGAAGLGGLVFGKRKDGSVAWPTWKDLQEAAVEVWNGIKLGASKIAEIAGAIVFGRAADGSVAWPTWNDVKAAAGAAWSGIKKGALTIAETFGILVFGKKDDGSVNWPEWSTLSEAAGAVWKTIQSKVTNIADTLGGYFFGRKSDGSVNWPTWDDIKSGAEKLWKTIKDKALNLADSLGGFVFGRNKDGSVAWPTWDDVKAGAEKLWKDIQTAATNIADTLGGLVFGREADGSVAWPKWTLADIQNAAKGLWKIVQSAARNIADAFGRLVFGTNADGEIAWPDWDISTVQAMAAQIWNTVKDGVGKLGGLIFGRDTEGSVKWPNWGDLQKVAKGAWKLFTGGVAKLGGLIFGRDEKGDVNWPSLDDLLKYASNLWSDLCAAVGKFTGLIFGVDDIEAVANTFRGLGDALKYVSAAIIGGTLAKKVKGLSDTIGSIINFKGGKLSGWTKFELIMAGLAAASLLIYEHWDEISEAAGKVAKWVDESIITPLRNFFAEIEGWLIDNILRPLGLWQPPTLTKEQIATMTPEEYAQSRRIPLEQAVTDLANLKRVSAVYDANDQVPEIMAEYAQEGAKAAAEAGIDTLEGLMQWYLTKFEKADIKRREDGTYDVTNQFGGKIGKGQPMTETGLFEYLSRQYKVFNTEATLTSGAFNNLTEAANSAASALSSINAGTDGSHAKGLWTVPYDNYLASLHRGERVLTASQARHMGESADGATIAAAVSSAVSKAMQDLSLVLNNRTVGKVFGDSTSRRVNKNINLTAERLAYGHGK